MQADTRTWPLGLIKTDYDIGKQLGGPLFTAYCQWLQEKVKLLDIHKVFYLARDGQILLELSQKLFPDAPGHYLYLSRQVLNLASIRELDDRFFRLFLTGTPVLTLHILENRLQTPLGDLLAQEGLHIDKDQTLNPSLIQQIREAMLRFAPLRQAVLDSASSHRAVLLEYLVQEGFFEQKQLAIVDLGWRGTMQDSLNRALGPGNELVIHGLYLANLRDPHIPPSSPMHAFCFDRREASLETAERFYRCYAHLELFASADHGTCLGYVRQHSRIEPLLGEKPQFDNRDLRRGIWDFFAEHRDGKRLPSPAECIEHLDSFHSFPSREAATLLGRIRYTSEPSETFLYEYAPKLTLWTIWRIFRDKQHVHTFWLIGSLARSSRWMVFLFLCKHFLMREHHALQSTRRLLMMR